MATIYIDNQPYEVPDGQNLLNACLSLGFDLPYFCWHPAMGSVGACRQCAVKQFKDENDTRGKIVMACMTPAANNTRISIDDPDAVAFRRSVIEWLMVNHPHDCPVCDEGGECHLQDMTVMTGHDYRRCRFKKRTHVNQYLGPFVHHEMNRCIQCYRCVRFYRDYADGRDFNVFACHDSVYYGRDEPGVLQNEFSGNLVEVCPTGVFTDETLYHHYTRKWDLTTAPSVCVHCGVGCNTIPGERYGMLRRVRNRFNYDVNGYFLCDRGRYGYEFVNTDRRLRQPMLRSSRDTGMEPVSPERVVAHVAGLVKAGRAIGIGSPRASLESNFALRTLVGPDRFFLGLSEGESALISAAIRLLRAGPARSASLHDIRTADAVLILGEDLTNTAPMMALAVRQAAKRHQIKIAAGLKIPEWDANGVAIAAQRDPVRASPIFIATAAATRLDEIAAATFRGAPDDLVRLALMIGESVGAGAASAPPPQGQVGRDSIPASGSQASEPGTESRPTSTPQEPGLISSESRPTSPEQQADPMRTIARQAAQALLSAEHPVVISGTGAGSEPLMQAAADVARALSAQNKPTLLALALPDCNSLGLGLIRGQPLSEAFQAVQDGSADTAIILENDLFRRAPAPEVQAFLERTAHVVVLDHISHDTAARADAILPAGTFAESDGTLVNYEGRAQRFYQVFVPVGDPALLQESWRWLSLILAAAGRLNESGHAPWQTLDDVLATLADALPEFHPVLDVAPPAGFRIAGERIARQSSRFSGRTAMLAHLSVHEPPPPSDPDSPLAFSMEGYQRQPPPPLIPRFWAPRWNSVQSLNKFQAEVGGPLRGGPAGRRLIEPPAPPQSPPWPQTATGGTQEREGQPGKNLPLAGPGSDVRDVPPHLRPVAGEPAVREWLLVPLYHIFGSEEQSRLAPGIAQLAPSAYLGLGPDAAAALGVAAGQQVDLDVSGRTFRLPVRLIHGLGAGMAGLPVGLPGMEGIALPTQGRLRPLETTS